MMNMQVMTSNQRFIVQAKRTAGNPMDTQAYFNYTSAVVRMIEFLREEFDADFRLYYQDNGNEIWNGLEEDIKNGYGGVLHAASIFDLVETQVFDFAAEAEQGQQGCSIRPAVRNNLFVYPKHGIAMARIPRLVMHGIGTEDLIFAMNDEGMGRFLEEMRTRQMASRKIMVFTDTRDGQEQTRESAVNEVTRDDVFMDESLKTQIYRSIDEFFSADRSFFTTYDIPYKRGILLYGKPGNGKTTLVKSISTTIDAPVAYWQITEYTNSESIQEVFSAAARMAPMVLVIEDIDSMPASCRSYFLNTLDGATSKEGIYLIGTTNYPEKIDPALMNRAGRFDRAYEVKLPNEQLRLAYLTRRGLPRLVGEDTVMLAARATEGFTLAQLGELYVSAALEKHYEGEVDLDRLISEMQADYSKDRKHDWMTDGKARKLGFM